MQSKLDEIERNRDKSIAVFDKECEVLSRERDQTLRALGEDMLKVKEETVDKENKIKSLEAKYESLKELGRTLQADYEDKQAEVGKLKTELQRKQAQSVRMEDYVVYGIFSNK